MKEGKKVFRTLCERDGGREVFRMEEGLFEAAFSFELEIRDAWMWPKRTVTLLAGRETWLSRREIRVLGFSLGSGDIKVVHKAPFSPPTVSMREIIQQRRKRLGMA